MSRDLQELKENVKIAKLAYKSAKKAKQRKKGSKLDEWRLSLYERFAKKAYDLRYKQADLEGWESDQAVIGCSKTINKLKKKKQLSDRDAEILLQLYRALCTVKERKEGKQWPLAEELIVEIQELHPDGESLAQAEAMFAQLDKVFQGA